PNRTAVHPPAQTRSGILASFLLRCGNAVNNWSLTWDGLTMKCPFCRQGDFAVVDSRSQRGSFPIRRRRSCTDCKRKVWTVEQIVEMPLQVVKKDETREPFEPSKIRRGLEKACYKRPVSSDQIDQMIECVQSDVYTRYFGEVPSNVL